MVTGSNSGIGLQIALEVAKRGGVIHMVCRNEEAAKKARSEIITTTGNDKIHLHIVDLSQPRDVILWVEKFAAQHDKLHVLVNNAGCMVHERCLDEDGVEVNFAVNTLAVHIITNTLIPLLQKSEDARVVIVSSAGLLNVRLDPHDLMHLNMEPFMGNLVYSQNKRQQVVMTLWYAQRFDKIHFSSMHPGWVDTNAIRTSIPQFYETIKDNLRTPAQGADTAVWLAISKAALKHPSGLFFQDREPVSTHLPLAWTKTSIEEEDLLMKNIQDIYLKVHDRAYNPPAPPTSAEPKKETDTVTKESTANTTPSEQTTSPVKETKAEVEIVKIPPPPAPRRDEPQNAPALTNPPASMSNIPATESVVKQSKEAERPTSLEVKAEVNSQLSSPEPYVTPEKPKVEDIAGTHTPSPDKQEPSSPESTTPQVTETPKLEPSDQLTSAISDMKLMPKTEPPAEHTQSDAPTQEKILKAPNPDPTLSQDAEVNKEINATPST